MGIKKTTAKKKKALTLIEMIVVLMLLTMITGALAYNYKGSLDKGKVFEKNEVLNRVRAVLEIALAEGDIKSQQEATEWDKLIRKSPLIKNAEKTITIATAAGLTVTYHPASGNDPAKLEIKPD